MLKGNPEDRLVVCENLKVTGIEKGSVAKEK